MAALGALAENQRRNERCDRGLITVAAGGKATLVLGPMANASATMVLANPYGEIGGMRAITHFELVVDDQGTAADGVTVTKPAIVTGSINSANQTIGSITYPPNTVLNINLYVATSATNPTLIQTGVAGKVRFTVWGVLDGSGLTF